MTAAKQRYLYLLVCLRIGLKHQLIGQAVRFNQDDLYDIINALEAECERRDGVREVADAGDTDDWTVHLTPVRPSVTFKLSFDEAGDSFKLNIVGVKNAGGLILFSASKLIKFGALCCFIWAIMTFVEWCLS